MPLDQQFTVTIQNLAQIKAAFAKAPKTTEEEMQKAVNAVPDILAKHTVPGVVPYRTGFLIQTFGRDVGRLTATWFPTRKYAPFVEYGTAPHIIRAKPGGVLANKATGQFFGPIVHHPGTKANRFMERIAQRAKGEINEAFETALDSTLGIIAAEAK